GVAARSGTLGLPFLRLPRIESRFPLLSLIRCLGAALRLRCSAPDLVLPFTLPANRCVRLMRAAVGARRSCWNQRDAEAPRHVLDRFTLRREPFALANGPAAAMAMRDVVPGLRVGLVPNGIALPPPRADSDSWRRRLAARGPVVLMLAHLHPGKGHDLILEAWAGLRSHVAASDAVLVFAGRDDGLAAPLQE